MAHLQLKDIPDRVHADLRSRAERDGVSMREYVLRLIEADLARVDTRAEMVARLRDIGPVLKDRSAADVIRETRAERERDRSA